MSGTIEIGLLLVTYKRAKCLINESSKKNVNSKNNTIFVVTFFNLFNYKELNTTENILRVFVSLLESIMHYCIRGKR